jgi:hypothetical protein
MERDQKPEQAAALFRSSGMLFRQMKDLDIQ